MTAYQVIWFVLVGVLLTVFAVLDGFDLGVGFWHLRAKGDEQRRTLLNAVGPVWDGNEVWLLTGGGALFAAFPPVYATVFSGFYLALMLLLLALITRAVAPEFRSQLPSPAWRQAWDVAFSVSSVVAGLLLAVALGNILRGIPLDADTNYAGSFLDLLNPYALLIGLLGLAMLAFHGALYIVLKAPGELESRARSWARGAGVAYLALYFAATAATIFTQPQLLENYEKLFVLWALPVLAPVAMGAGLLFNARGRAGLAFASSSTSIVVLMLTCGAGLFPALVPALGEPERSLTLMNASSSELTLKVMLLLTVLVLPLVLGYTFWAYRAFAGKVDLGHDHY